MTKRCLLYIKGNRVFEYLIEKKKEESERIKFKRY